MERRWFIFLILGLLLIFLFYYGNLFFLISQFTMIGFTIFPSGPQVPDVSLIESEDQACEDVSWECNWELCNSAKKEGVCTSNCGNNKDKVLDCFCDYNVVYSDWSDCSQEGVESREVVSKSPEGCVVKDLSLTRTCDYIPLCGEDDWTYVLSPNVCSVSGKQSITWSKIGQCSGGVTHHFSEEVECDYMVPVCTSVSYTDWSSCGVNSIQSRFYLSKIPEGCIDENPILSRQCKYIPQCTDDHWSYYLDPSECPSSGIQTKYWDRIGECADGIDYLGFEEIACDYTAPRCEFVFSEWGDCLPGDVQKRDILSEGPDGCDSGSPLIESTCDYIFCTSNQIIGCEMVDNGIVSGYKDKCNDEGSEYIGENTCEFVCNEGYVKDFDRCVENNIIENYVSILTKDNLILESLEGRIEIRVKDDEKFFIVLEGLSEENVNIEGVEIIRSSVEDSKEFIIVQNLDIEGFFKTVYLEKKDSRSNAVCVRDSSDVRTLEDINEDCDLIACPSESPSYSCRVDENYLTVSGLRHSGVVESKLYCGDGICIEGESCSSCLVDCGNCPVQTSYSGSRGGGSITKKFVPKNESAEYSLFNESVVSELEENKVEINSEVLADDSLVVDLEKGYNYSLLIFWIFVGILILVILFVSVLLVKKLRH
jgi:hypothetical protein